MLESTVELLGGLFVSALLLLMGFCIVGSTVAALRAVSQGSATLSRRREEILWLKESRRTGESCATQR